jgi:hypothetical protein
MYAVPTDDSIEQGDVFDECPLPVLADTSAGAVAVAGLVVPKVTVVVLTQTCDLVQAKASRAVVAVTYPTQLLVARQILKPATVRDQVRLGKVHGWYFLPASSELVGLPESVIDLRDLHTIPVAVLNQLIANGKRRCRITTPYREHLAQHFAVTYMRIALPEPYETQP